MRDLSNKENLLLDESIDVGFGTTKALKKEAQNFMVKLIKKLKE